MASLKFLPLLLLAAFHSGASARDPQPIEPIDIPPSVEQGIDMIYIDPELAADVRGRAASPLRTEEEDALSPVEQFFGGNPFYVDLRRGLARYRLTWGSLPQIEIPAGPVLKPGARSERAALVRQRLGLSEGDAYDAETARAVRRYQEVHGLKADGILGEGTVRSLNLGADHYERLLMLNLDRARRLPDASAGGRYVIVDAGASRLYMFEDGRAVDSMRVIVGKPESPTPMMAALIRYASVNPYWNVPPDLVQTLIAPKVISEGLGHIEAERYELLSDWSEDASVLDPAAIDWPAVGQGKTELRVRQLPGRANSMGKIKFMLPNDYGIYLHDTPDRALFERSERWISNGCVRVEDARRLASWLFGSMPEGSDPNREERVDLESPVPVYITYLTAGPTKDGIAFRGDPYGRDAPLLARYAAEEESQAET